MTAAVLADLLRLQLALFAALVVPHVTGRPAEAPLKARVVWQFALPVELTRQKLKDVALGPDALVLLAKEGQFHRIAIERDAQGVRPRQGKAHTLQSVELRVGSFEPWSMGVIVAANSSSWLVWDSTNQMSEVVSQSDGTLSADYVSDDGAVHDAAVEWQHTREVLHAKRAAISKLGGSRGAGIEDARLNPHDYGRCARTTLSLWRYVPDTHHRSPSTWRTLVAAFDAGRRTTTLTAVPMRYGSHVSRAGGYTVVSSRVGGVMAREPGGLAWRRVEFDDVELLRAATITGGDELGECVVAYSGKRNVVYGYTVAPK